MKEIKIDLVKEYDAIEDSISVATDRKNGIACQGESALVKLRVEFDRAITNTATGEIRWLHENYVETYTGHAGIGLPEKITHGGAGGSNCATLAAPPVK